MTKQQKQQLRWRRRQEESKERESFHMSSQLHNVNVLCWLIYNSFDNFRCSLPLPSIHRFFSLPATQQT